MEHEYEYEYDGILEDLDPIPEDEHMVRIREYMEEIGHPDSGIALWLILGEEYSDSGGGESSIFALTSGATKLPDSEKAIVVASGGKYEFGSVDMIGLVSGSHGNIPSWSNGSDITRDFTSYPVVDQTGLNLSEDQAETIASILIEYLSNFRSE